MNWRQRDDDEDALLLTFNLPYFLGSPPCAVAVLEELRRAGLVGLAQPQLVDGTTLTDDGDLAAHVQDAVGGPFEIDVPFPRATGIVSLDFASAGTLVVLDCDAYLIRPVGDSWLWANAVAVNVRSTRDADELVEAVPGIADRLGASFAWAMTTTEWLARHTVDDGRSITTVGLDVTGSLPPFGVVTYFDRSISDGISGPTPEGTRYRETEHGIAVQVDGPAYRWRERQATIDRCRDWLVTSLAATGRLPTALAMLGQNAPLAVEHPPSARSCSTTN